jgi:hypothetical protein
LSPARDLWKTFALVRNCPQRAVISCSEFLWLAGEMVAVFHHESLPCHISNITPNPPAAIPVSSADPLVKKSRNCWPPAFSGHVQVQRWRAHVSMTPRLATFRLALLATSAFIRTRLNKKEFSYDDTRK